MTNPNQIKTPRILQERTGPTLREQSRDKIVEWRKKISVEMGRVIADITFNKSSIEISDFDSNTSPDKFIQDLAFRSYEPNLRETHYREQREWRSYHARRLGSIAMMIPGVGFIGETISDTRLSHKRQHNRRKQYIARNGTVKSHLREQYVAHKEEFGAGPRGQDS